MWSKRAVCSVLLLLFGYAVVWAEVISSQIRLSDYNYVTVSTCSAQGYNYFDSSAHACKNCPTNQIGSTTSIDGIGNSDSCQCANGYIQQSTPCSSGGGSCQGFNCTSCLSLSKASYSDLTGCAACGSTTTGSIDTSDNDCACSSSSQVLVETDIAGNKLSEKSCLTCPSGKLPVKTSQTIAGKAYTGSKYICQSCPDAKMTMSLVNNVYACSCRSDYTIAGISGIGIQQCIPNSLATSFSSQVNSARTVNYATLGITVSNSQVFGHYFLQAASYCTFFGGANDVKHCQILANLCVLQLYDTSSTVCSIFNNIVSNVRSVDLQQNVYNITQWGLGMPWLTYSTLYKGNTICKYPDLYTDTVSLNRDHLAYVVAIYAMNGTFIGYEPLNTLFSYCGVNAPLSGKGGGTASSTTWQYFATSQGATYTCSLRSLLQRLSPSGTSAGAVSETRFYELFLFDRVSGKFTPVPVAISVASASSISSTSVISTLSNSLCSDSDQLVRRFFLFDGISGISTLNSDPRVVRYAASITIMTQLIPQTTSGEQGASSDEIYSPVLRIQYAESAPASWASKTFVKEAPTATTISTTSTTSSTTTSTTTDDEVTYSLQVFYISDMTTFYTILQGFSIALLIVFLVFFGVRYHNWNMRHARIITQAGLTTDLGGANIKLCGEILLLLINSYVLIFFPYTVLVSWYFFVFFKLQKVPSIMLPAQDYNISSDNYLSSSSPYFLLVINLYIMTFFQVIYVSIKVVYRQCQADVFFVDWEPLHAGNDTHATNDNNRQRADTKQQQQVSVWRTLLVANEFSELQTQRRSNPSFTLVFLAFFLIGLRLQYNATWQPDLNDLSANKLNVVLRFANETFFWLAISAAQYLWKFVIYERYFSEPPEQVFVDVCTLAKVSVFMLDEKFHGFYLHCRSPHQHAEANMLELVEMLAQEEAGLTTDRSLDGAPVDVQSFQLFLSSETRDAFDAIYAILAQPQSVSELIDQRRNRAALRMQNNQNNNRTANATGIQMQGLLGGRRSGLGNLRSGGTANTLKLGWAGLSAPPSQRVLQAWQEMTLFLQQFVENNLGSSGLRRVVHEPSYLEWMMNSAPDLTQANLPSVFYTDRAMKFTSVLFLGSELDLLLANILTYSLFQVWFNDALTAILLCYVVDWAWTYVRANYGNVRLALGLNMLEYGFECSQSIKHKCRIVPNLLQYETFIYKMRTF